MTPSRIADDPKALVERGDRLADDIYYLRSRIAAIDPYTPPMFRQQQYATLVAQHDRKALKLTEIRKQLEAIDRMRIDPLLFTWSKK